MFVDSKIQREIQYLHFSNELYGLLNNDSNKMNIYENKLKRGLLRKNLINNEKLLKKKMDIKIEKVKRIKRKLS